MNKKKQDIFEITDDKIRSMPLKKAVEWVMSWQESDFNDDIDELLIVESRTLNYFCEELLKSIDKVDKLHKVLRNIKSSAGMPDAKDACRIIIGHCHQASVE